MFLEKIRIKGFKSFAHPLTIEFDSPLTAIVGPNGSGKSNIVDAIRWVLGEQSAKTLRGERMADIIFAGSEGHPARNKALVELNINNEDGLLEVDMDQVEIKRTVDTSGQSDYYLNDSRCRLKDIKELLMDTGLGENSYSIVGQGQITSIINSKPQELRSLFEESAGISKHKSRKAQTEKRLEKNQKELNRVADLITELKRQLPKLEEEAQKTREYNEKSRELAYLETNLLVDKWQQYKDDLTALKSKHEKCKQKLQKKEKSCQKIKKQLKKKQQQLEQLEQKREQAREEFYSLQAKKEEAENRLKILAEKKNSLTREKKEKSDQIEKLEKKNLSLQEDKNTLQEQKSELQKNIEKKKSNLEQVDQRISQENKKIESLEEKLVELQEKFVTDREREKIREKKNRLEEKINQLIEYLPELLSRGKEQLNRGNKLLDKKNKLEAELKKSQDEFDQLEKKLTNARQTRDKIIQKLKKVQSKHEKVDHKYDDIESRLDFLEDRHENYRGFYQGVKCILQHKDRFSGLIGVVSNLIQVRKKYETAVAAALGSRLQNIVVETEQTARQAINFLKSRNGGQATFLPLDRINSYRLNPEELTINNSTGFLGIGADIIDTTGDYKKLSNYLLGNIIFSDNLENASQIAGKLNGKFKVVSLEGEIINPGGSMTGGSKKNRQEQFLVRKREIKEMEKQLAEVEKKKQHLTDKLNKWQQKRKENKKKINKFSQQLQEKEYNRENLLRELKNCYQNLSELTSRPEKIIEKCFSRLAVIKDTRKKYEQSVKKLTQADKDFSREKEYSQQLQQKIADKKQKRSDIQETKTTYRVELGSLKQELTDLKKDIEKKQEQLTENNEQITELNNRITAIRQKTQEIDQKETKFEKQVEEYKTKVTDRKQQKESLDKEISAQKEKINRLEEKMKPVRKKVDQLQKKSHKLEIKIKQRENKQERIEEKLVEKYDFLPGKDEPDKKLEIENYSAVQRKINKLTQKKEELEPVNQGAVKEYRELKKRVDYLSEQKEDLISARESLQTIISEIEENMGRLFYENFQAVREEFETIFQKLFEGGKAELKLTEADDYLNTGIEIEAQPPGKQQKSLTLLSGGERALTAIALVFAFLQVNPSPLYILDEIDAPLDDANLARFTHFIEHYSELAQFILITHRKYMMSHADTLYGVTMEESGISRVISLKLNEEGVDFATN